MVSESSCRRIVFLSKASLPTEWCEHVKSVQSFLNSLRKIKGHEKNDSFSFIL